MNVEGIISTLSERYATSLKQLQTNAERVLKRAPEDASALALLAAIRLEWDRRNPPPMNGWTTGSQGAPRHLYRDGERVATVVRNETHGLNKGGYDIWVLGKRLDASPRHIDEARALAEAQIGWPT